MYNNSPVFSYIRNYPEFSVQTFHPFKHKGEWYALYSKDYTCTRVAKLTPNGMVDWCGEEPNSGGFCPTDYYVPRYKLTKYSFRGEPLEVEHFENDYSEKELDEYYEMGPDKLSDKEEYCGEHYCNYGFLSGCIWGDDNSWKIRFIDFSELENQVLKIEEKFGYFELPPELNLRECIKNSSETGFMLYEMKRFHIEDRFQVRVGSD